MVWQPCCLSIPAYRGPAYRGDLSGPSFPLPEEPPAAFDAPPRTVRSGATLEPAKRQSRPIRSCAFRKPSEGTRLLAPTSGTARPVGGLGKEARSSQAAQPRSSGLDRVHQIPPVYRASGDLARVNFSRRFSHSSELKNLGPTSIRRGIMLNTAIRLHGRPSRMRNPFSFRSLTIAE